jgi:hypothetical protein
MVLLLAVSVSGLGVCVGECTGWRSWLGPPPCDDDVDEGTRWAFDDVLWLGLGVRSLAHTGTQTYGFNN